MRMRRVEQGGEEEESFREKVLPRDCSKPWTEAGVGDGREMGNQPWSKYPLAQSPRATQAGDGRSDPIRQAEEEQKSGTGGISHAPPHRSLMPSSNAGNVLHPGLTLPEVSASGKERESMQPGVGTLTTVPSRKAGSRRPAQMLYNPRERMVGQVRPC